MIQFENVTATYKKNVGIFNISFKVKEGDMVFIMGPTGSGKSTILKTIYKDMLVEAGKIIINKEDITAINSSMHTSNVRKNIGMVFQDFKLLEDRTVFENIALPLRIEGYSKSQIIESVKESNVNFPLEIEVNNIDQIKEALKTGVDGFSLKQEMGCS